jgi:hypothetical protein
LEALWVCLGGELRVQGAQLIVFSHVANFRQGQQGRRVTTALLLVISISGYWDQT